MPANQPRESGEYEYRVSGEIEESFRDLKSAKGQVDVLPLWAGLSCLEELTGGLLATASGPIVVGIAGGTGSGKTNYVAKFLAEAFPGRSAIFSLDHYFKGKSFLELKRGEDSILNHDHPEYVDLTCARDQLRLLLGGIPVQQPVYSFQESARVGSRAFEPASLIIVEGLHTLHGPLDDVLSLRVFVESTLHTRLMRRIIRGAQERGEEPAANLESFAGTVEPMYRMFIQTSRAKADLIIENNICPTSEMHGLGALTLERSYPGVVNENLLRASGAVRLGLSQQEDTFFASEEADFSATGELIRVRREGDIFTICYQCPAGQDRAYKFSFEFEALRSTCDCLSDMYVMREPGVQRLRTTWALPGGGIVYTEAAAANSTQSEAQSTVCLPIRDVQGGAESRLKEIESALGLTE